MNWFKIYKENIKKYIKVSKSESCKNAHRVSNEF